ncbi:methyl-accepting chemotaxis protein [Sporosarcina sp. Te-1]|uniref:methyl-accepting chemotaxis protein n=1 Tax=Sporosarcina sp. Te-1 TaxID=2818390 RepID=UPI001A9EB773|nr:methyl-accepting chemotaxis protein [Sporosarcina sp. Te-1]QTD41260.1 methyl-accepting chemotaxis protein [Sporosarcina sp. Te-1]
MKHTVGKKIWFGFLSVLLIMIVIGASSLWSLFKVSDEYRFLIDDRMKKIVLLEELSANQNEISNNIRGYMLYKEPRLLEDREQLNKEANQLLEELDSLVKSESASKILADVIDRISTHESMTGFILEEFQKGNEKDAIGQAYEATGQLKKAKDGIDQLIEHQNNQRDKTEKDLHNVLLMTRILTIGLIAVAIVGSIIVARVISNSIARPVAALTTVIKQMADGNFSSEPIQIKNKDEIGEMASAFNVMASDIRHIISHTRETAVQLAVQAEELSASSEESLAASEMVAEIAEKNIMASDAQVAIVQESNASMKEMEAGIDRITEENDHMLKSTGEVTHLVSDGASLMTEFTVQMKSINQTMEESVQTISEMASQSEQIRSVTSLITAIAEQTNLLALNAAIEAARAGEHGKGFAVVAEEVRNLAEQSKQSAEEIGRMVETMIQNVNNAVARTEDGSRRVADGLTVTGKTNEVFEQIEKAAVEVADKVNNVSAAIVQMTSMVNEVATGAAEVEKLAVKGAAEAQSTSAATEQQLAANQEISSSSQQLATLAEKLQSDLSKFTV